LVLTIKTSIHGLLHFPLQNSTGHDALEKNTGRYGAWGRYVYGPAGRECGTRHHLCSDLSNGGRTAYTNAPKTERQGLELSAQTQLPWQLQASVAYTWLSAKVVETYSLLNVNGTATAVVSGNRIPGVPDQGLFAEIMWRKSDKSLEFALEGRAAGSIAANDVNAAYAGGYGIMNLRAVARQSISGWSLTEFARIDNLLDRAYVGSLIVNQSASQFYESAPGRNWLAGVRAAYRF